jgi:hypothetical protein
MRRSRRVARPRVPARARRQKHENHSQSTREGRPGCRAGRSTTAGAPIIESRIRWVVGADPLTGGAAARRWGGAGGAKQILQVCSLCLVGLEGAGQPVDHTLGDPVALPRSSQQALARLPWSATNGRERERNQPASRTRYRSRPARMRAKASNPLSAAVKEMATSLRVPSPNTTVQETRPMATRPGSTMAGSIRFTGKSLPSLSGTRTRVGARAVTLALRCSLMSAKAVSPTPESKRRPHRERGCGRGCRDEVPSPTVMPG